MASEQLYVSRRKSRPPFQIKSSPWHSGESPGSREVSPLSRESSTSPAPSDNHTTKVDKDLAALQQQERREEYTSGSESGSSPRPVQYQTHPGKVGYDSTHHYHQFDIKNAYAEDTLGIIPMPVEVGSPSSMRSEDEEHHQSKRLKLSDGDDAEGGDRTSEYNNMLSSTGQMGGSDEGADRRDSMMKKVGKVGEGKSAPRTVILPVQREALERLWQLGMKSTSRKLRTLQEQAQQETGLRMDIIHNWIHNRRRKKNQEELVNRASKDNHTECNIAGGDHSDDSDISHQTNESHLIPSVTPTSQLMVLNPQHMEGTMTISSRPTFIPSFTGPLPVTVLNPAAMTNIPPVVTMDTIHRPSISVIQKQTPIKPFPEISRLTSPRGHEVKRDILQTPVFRSVSNQTDPLDTREGILEPFVAKVCCNKKELTHGDFIEVDVPVRTYSALLHTLCQELGIHRKTVARIRKLPDVWVRGDSDVQRMKDFVELEVVLRDEAQIHLSRS